MCLCLCMCMWLRVFVYAKMHAPDVPIYLSSRCTWCDLDTRQNGIRRARIVQSCLMASRKRDAITTTSHQLLLSPGVVCPQATGRFAPQAVKHWGLGQSAHSGTTCSTTSASGRACAMSFDCFFSARAACPFPLIPATSYPELPWFCSPVVTGRFNPRCIQGGS